LKTGLAREMIQRIADSSLECYWNPVYNIERESTAINPLLGVRSKRNELAKRSLVRFKRYKSNILYPD
jgi:hypothetical protein